MLSVVTTSVGQGARKQTLTVANPDLLQRIVKGEELNPYDRSTFYTPGVVGYTE